MTEKEYYIGMDVHKDSVQMAVFEETGEEPIYESTRNVVDTEFLLWCLDRDTTRYSVP